MFGTMIQVALGGAIGATARFSIGLWLVRFSTGFPVAILCVNVIGSFLMGMIAVWTYQRGFEHLNPVLLTGILGGFTTFSAFSLEAYTLFERGQVGSAALYVVLSVVLSLLALAVGVMIARGIWI